MRTALVGTVVSTRVALDGLASVGQQPLAVVTLPPERSTRHSDYVDLGPDARAMGIEVIYAVDINAPEVLEALARLDLDFLFVIGWSQLCGRDLLGLPRSGTIGFHPSALPKNRGRAVVPWTIIQGLKRTGSTLLWLDEGMDSGDVLAQETFDLSPDETAASLYDKHLGSLATMIKANAVLLAEGGAPPRVTQNHSAATYCARRTKQDGWIDWQRPANEVWTLIRAVGDPYPGAFTAYRQRTITVWSAEMVPDAPFVGTAGQVQAISSAGAVVRCGDGDHVLIKTVQLDGGERVSAADIVKVHGRLGLDPVEVWRAIERGGGDS